ncbi:hypothetical protein M378DRAFT_166201 [Amanita muscaria Koide BX008]|uniref:Uncharacterized protein n=1 Tax=Amanita muscaria (strain Koide BX008) TaxID=946122 RepID=A0A0C2WYX5_AMAMK|nr:hypothetical protein M378DRAFT_166201 [Amanita muscaria Koide BX008]
MYGNIVLLGHERMDLEKSSELSAQASRLLRRLGLMRERPDLNRMKDGIPVVVEVFLGLM